MSPKELKKLATACRAAGITQFKNSEVEFTLSDVSPQIRKRSKKSEVKSTSYEQQAAEFESDSIPDEELLFWSAGGNLPGSNKESA